MISILFVYFFCFFNDTATTEIYTLSLHDALPISPRIQGQAWRSPRARREAPGRERSEEHTSELQSQSNLVCRLLLEKNNKKKKKKRKTTNKRKHTSHITKMTCTSNYTRRTDKTDH